MTEEKKEIKKQLYEACAAAVEKGILSIEEALKSIEESRNNETKSSVGDKYETGRSMMQMEEEKNRSQLYQAYQVRQVLGRIDPRAISARVQTGSLVETNRGDYYVAVGLGKLKVGGKLYYCVSADSPIGKQMLGKSVGDELAFNGNTIRIAGIW